MLQLCGYIHFSGSAKVSLNVIITPQGRVKINLTRDIYGMTRHKITKKPKEGPTVGEILLM